MMTRPMGRRAWLRVAWGGSDQGNELHVEDEALEPDPVLPEDREDGVGEGHGIRVVAVDAEGRHILLEQPDDLGFDLRGIVKDGVLVRPGNKRAVLSVAAVRE